MHRGNKTQNLGGDRKNGKKVSLLHEDTKEQGHPLFKPK